MDVRPCMSVVVCLLVSFVTLQAQAKPNPLILSRPLTITGSSLQYYDASSVSCLENKQVDCSIHSPEDAVVSHEVYRSKLGCYKGKNIAAGNIVGHCEYTVTYHYNYVDGDAEYPTVSGGFYGTCYLKKPAEECVEPFCEDMVLSVQGHIYYLEDVVTDDPCESLMYKCFRDSDGPLSALVASKKKRHHDNGKVPQAADKETASIARDSGKKPLYLAVDADVMSGPVTVFCHKSGKTWSGWFETPIYINTEDVMRISHAEAADKAFVRANDVLLKVFKEPGYEK